MRIGQLEHLASAQTHVATGRVVETVGESKAVLGPGEQTDTVIDRLQQDVCIAQPGQVGVGREVLDQLLHRHLIAAPERDALQFQAQACRGKGGQIQIIAAQLPAGARGQGIAAGQA